MLSLAPDAPADEIKRAFRREIARYHPDKVQHLGQEFQEMASGIAADLTEAYRILMDPALRAKYDHEQTGGRTPPAAHKTPASQQPEKTAPSHLKRATLVKMREAIDDVLANAKPMTVPGFDIALVTLPRKGLFKAAEESVCLLVKFVPFVDALTVAEAWPGALKAQAPVGSGCVLLLIGPGMSAAPDLAGAVKEQRRKSRNAGPVLVPVDVRDWEALFPPETPTSVRALIQRLKEGKP